MDEQALEMKYQEDARNAIRERLVAEAAKATEVQPTNTKSDGTQGETSSNTNMRLWMAMLFVVVVVIVVIVVVIVPRKDTAPQDVDRAMEQRENLISKLLEATGRTTDDDLFSDLTSSHSMAVSWLLEDDHSLDVEPVEVSDEFINILLRRYVLALLYFSTNGDQWNTKDGFLGNASVCDWWGITCDVTDSITIIDLST